MIRGQRRTRRKRSDILGKAVECEGDPKSMSVVAVHSSMLRSKSNGGAEKSLVLSPVQPQNTAVRRCKGDFDFLKSVGAEILQYWAMFAQVDTNVCTADCGQS